MSDQAVMIDIETLAKTEDAVVVSLGAVQFDLRERSTVEQLRQNGFYTVFGAKSQTRRRICAETLSWWMAQRPEVRAELQASLGLSEHYSAGVDRFLEWIYHAAPHTVWANSPQFDLAMLRSLIDNAAGEYYDPRFSPLRRADSYWSFRQERDLRTIWNAFPVEARAASHHALDDAIRQAQVLQRIYTENPELKV